jgi:hypothetical protein
VDKTDPFGLYTLSVCLSGSGELGPVAGTAGLCIARTRDTGSDDIGWTFTAGGGWGTGEDVGGSYYYEVSTCNTLSCLSSWFNYASLGFNVGIGASLTIFWGNYNSNLRPTTFGGDIGINAGAGAEGSVGATYTWVHKSTCSEWQFGCTAFANSLRVAWNAAAWQVQWIVNRVAAIVGTMTAKVKTFLQDNWQYMK